MGRSQSNQAFQQSEGQSAQDQANAQSSIAGANKSLTDYSSNLDNFMKFGRDTYGQNGEFARDENTIANTTASAGAKSTAADLALNKLRTGANSASYAPTLASSRNQQEQNLTNQLATADATRLQNLTGINQFGVQASALPAQIQSSLYGTSLSGATGTGGNAVSAAKYPGFMEEFGQDLAGAAGGVAKALSK